MQHCPTSNFHLFRSSQSRWFIHRLRPIFRAGESVIWKPRQCLVSFYISRYNNTQIDQSSAILIDYCFLKEFYYLIIFWKPVLLFKLPCIMISLQPSISARNSSINFMKKVSFLITFFFVFRRGIYNYYEYLFTDSMFSSIAT